MPHAELLAWLEAECGHRPEKEYEERDALSAAELREMQPHVEFGAHTMYHPILPNCDDATCNAEIAESKKTLEALLDAPVAHFAYPNGDYGARELRCAAEAGYRSARSTGNGWNDAETERFALKAMVVSDCASLNVLCGQVSGIFGTARRLRGGDR